MNRRSWLFSALGLLGMATLPQESEESRARAGTHVPGAGPISLDYQYGTGGSYTDHGIPRRMAYLWECVRVFAVKHPGKPQYLNCGDGHFEVRFIPKP